MENTYENAYVEVLEILKYIPKNEFEQIPKEEIDFFEKNRNVNYQYDYEVENPVTLRKTDVILVSLYKNYLATLEEKEKINEILKLNEQKSELKKRQEYENKPLFEKQEFTKQENALVVRKKENWIEKIVAKIKNFLNLR